MAPDSNAQSAISANGIIESTNGGFKFPDGSVQTTASVATSACHEITSVPITIEAEGIYCLMKNLDYSGTTGLAIDIEADNVTVDLNGWKLEGPAVTSLPNSSGIYAFDQQNVIVRNGTVKGFSSGVAILGPDSRGSIVEGIRAYQNAITGIRVDGAGNIVRQNQVFETGGIGTDTYATGISVTGSNNQVLHNDISGMVSTGTASSAGLSVGLGSEGTLIEGNRISNVSGDTLNNRGIIISSADNIMVIDNRISTTHTGVYFTSSTGKYRDNVTINITSTAYSGGFDAGNNN